MSKAFRRIGTALGGPLGRKGDVPAYGGPQNYYTGNSSLVGGNLSLDPSIRDLQNNALNRSNAIFGDIGNATSRYLTQNQSLRDSLNANNGAFIQARVDPITRQFGTLRASTQENLGRRGLSGSSFYDQSMNNLATDQGLAEGDARANATMESIAAQSGLDQGALSAAFQRATSQSQQNNESYAVAQQRLMGELAALGLDKDQIAQMMKQFSDQQAAELANYNALTNRLGVALSFGSKTMGSSGGGGGVSSGGGTP
jgi:hypothetical protein